MPEAALLILRERDGRNRMSTSFGHDYMASLRLAVPLGVLAVLQVLDTWSTQHGLSQGAVEVNPAAGWFVDRNLLLATKLALVCALALLSWIAVRNGSTRPILWTWWAAGAYVLIVWINVAQLL